MGPRLSLSTSGHGFESWHIKLLFKAYEKSFIVDSKIVSIIQREILGWLSKCVLGVRHGAPLFGLFFMSQRGSLFTRYPLHLIYLSLSERQTATVCPHLTVLASTLTLSFSLSIYVSLPLSLFLFLTIFLSLSAFRHFHM